MNEKPAINKSKKFAVRIIKLYKYLSDEKKEYTEFKNTVFNEELTNDFTYITIENLPAIIGEIRKSNPIPTISDFTKNDLNQDVEEYT